MRGKWAASEEAWRSRMGSLGLGMYGFSGSGEVAQRAEMVWEREAPDLWY